MASRDNHHQTGKNHHLIQAMGHAINGIYDVLSEERNMRFHLLAGVTVVICGFIFHISRFEWMWILLAILLVFSAEFLNTVVEAVTDLLSEHHYDRYVKRAKDVAAGGVLLTAIFAVLIGLLVFIPAIMRLW